MEIKCSYSELISVGKLVAHPKNSNEHPKRQIELLAKILAFQGFRHPIVVSKLSNQIVAGHGRLAAAIHAGYTEVPVDYQDFENAAQELAFLESDNLIADLAMHNDDIMLQNIKDLDLDDGFDLELFGIFGMNKDFLDPENQVSSLQGEWDGMPEFESQDPCYAKVVVSFDTEEDRADFFKKIGQSFTEKTKSVWFPEKERRDMESMRWAEENENA